MKLLALALVSISATRLCGAIQDITIPLDNGSLAIRNARFRGSDNQYSSTGKQLLLSFVLENRTSSSWNNIDLEFKMGGFCNGETREWSYVFHSGYITSGTSPTTKQFQETVGPLPGKNMECNAEIIKARLVSATACDNPLCLGTSGRRIEGPSNEPLDIEKEFESIQAEHAVEAEEKRERDAAEAERLRRVAAAEAERAAEARAERVKSLQEQARAAEEAERSAEEQAKKDAAEAARLKKIQAEAHAQYVKLKAEKDAREAAERARVRAGCSLIYDKTADKKVGDLTVREAQQVQACQVLGLYPPR
jgi:hypothetical protein